MGGPTVHSIVDEGLGNTYWLVDLGDGRALAVDPPRDLRALRRLADRHGLSIAYAADTHLHADYLSGAVQLGTDDGAALLASAEGGRAYRHRGLADGDEVDLGGLGLEAVSTPGHTDEHLAYVLRDGGSPVGVFTGGSLIVGSAARTDLLGADRTDELARAQFASLRRLTELPDQTRVWPTHGAGSFCSAPPGSARSSTIGAEKAGNPLLAAPDVDAFVERLLGSLGSYPAYFGRPAEINRRGPEVVATSPTLPGLSATAVRALLAEGAVAVDVRPVSDVAAGHVPGSIAIPLREQYATWLGWIVDPDVPIVIVRDPGQDAADILWPALNIGYSRIVGELTGGIAAWTAAGFEVATNPVVRPDRLPARGVVDVRQRAEFASGHVPGAAGVELGSLTGAGIHAVSGPKVVMCGHGERAMTGATLLERAGHRGVGVLIGGVDDWAYATGGRAERGT